MSQLVCSSCLLNFPEEQAYKDHYKTDFHRYNIARKMINLAPVSFEAYKEKFDKISEQKIITPIQSQTFKCCNKEFKSSKTYQAHLISKTHQQNQLKSPITTNRSQTGDSLLNSNVCLFCDELCDNIEECLKHMSNHGFFIREQKHCINIEGLLKALSEQINKNNTCLHCFQTFKNSHATKDHMLDKGHCFMPQQEYKVLSKYYNFEDKLLGILAEQKQQQLQIEAKKQQLQLKQDQKDDENDKKIEKQVEDEGDWEDDDEDIDIDSDDENEEEDLKIKQKQADDLQTDEELRQKRLKQLLKQISKHKATLTKTGELLLPDGKLLGHRDYRKYYKQNHIPFKQNEETEQIEQLDIADEKQLAVLSNELIVGHLRHFYYQKTRTFAHGQTKKRIKKQLNLNEMVKKILLISISYIQFQSKINIIIIILYMITKFITFKIDLSAFNSVKQIVQLTNGYTILGEQIVEQKLKSMTIALNNQFLLYFEIQNGFCKSEQPYQIGQGLFILSNIVANDNFLVALISRQGNRSLIQFNPKEQTNFFLIPNLPYQQYQLDCESKFQIISFNDRIILIEIHKSDNLLILEILSHPKAQRTQMKCKTGQNIQIQKIHNTKQILIIIDEDFHIFDVSNDIIKINKSMPAQFKIKFVIEIENQQIVILKDRVDKFYKFCDFHFDSDYFFTLKCKELLNGQIKIETEKKQSINLSKFKGEFYIWISTIYNCNDDDQKVLYINGFKLNSQFQAQFIENYKFWKSQRIEFIFKDEFVHEYILFRDQQTIKGFYIS